MPRYLVLGDTHGNTPFTAAAIGFASERDIRTVIQVGDFGLWPGRGGLEFLDMTNMALIANKVDLWWLDGNHEWFDGLEKMISLYPKTDLGMHPIRSNIHYSPRGNLFNLDGKWFQTVGGAVSIDRGMRTPGKSWWPQEELTDSEVNGIVRYAEIRDERNIKTDYLFTHDCSDMTPWGFRLVPDFKSQAHRQKIDRILDAVKPKLHFHGHMHRKFDWQRPTNDYDRWIQTYGLDCDGMPNSFGILDTESDSFTFENL